MIKKYNSLKYSVVLKIWELTSCIFKVLENFQVVSYMESSVFESKVKCMENIQDSAASLVQSQNNLTR